MKMASARAASNVSKRQVVDETLSVHLGAVLRQKVVAG